MRTSTLGWWGTTVSVFVFGFFDKLLEAVFNGVNAKRKIFINHLHGVLNIVEK